MIPGPLVYSGGRTQNAPVVYVVYWGWGSDPYGVQAYLNDFLLTVGSTPWLSTVLQYSSSGNPANLYKGSWSDPTPIPTQPTDAQIQSEAVAALQHFGLGNTFNVQIVVATPTGHSTAGFGVYPNGFCAYHGVLTADSNVTYTNLPYMPDAGSTCGYGLVNGPLDGVSILEGHELAESITDPMLNAWKDSSGNEIADKCQWALLGNLTTSLGTFAVQGLWSNAANTCVLSTSADSATVNVGSWSSYLGFAPANALQPGSPAIGSISPTTLANGLRYGEVVDERFVVTSFTVLSVSGFSSDPGTSWLIAAALNGNNYNPTWPGQGAIYSYSGGTARWQWVNSANGMLPGQPSSLVLAHK
jgi:hypothetical protein